VIQCRTRVVGAPNLQVPVGEWVSRGNYMKIALAVDFQQRPAHAVALLKQDWWRAARSQPHEAAQRRFSPLLAELFELARLECESQ
jgi:hypothetical protein